MLSLVVTMPSPLHEQLIDLLRTRPTLAAELLSRAAGLPIDSACAATARTSSQTFAQLQPPEYRADLVLLFGGVKPTFGVVIEAQLARDRNKRFVWPFFVAGLRAKLRVPCCLLVIAPKPSVAKWAATPIDLGQPGCQFVPVVLGPAKSR